jgi:ubiquinone/menaquinone biosynthesis C-methylase UbiE
LENKLSRKNIVKEHFSKRSGYWDSLYDDTNQKQNFTRFELRRRKEIVFDFISKLAIETGITALDLGCGAGQYLLGLSDLGIKAYGADISKDMLVISSEKLKKANLNNDNLLCADCYNIPLQSNKFDLIICIGVLEYLNKETFALSEIKRMLKPDGKLIVTLPNFYKLRNLLNPYYYSIRVWSYLFGKSVKKKSSANYGEIKIDFGVSTVTRYNLIKAKKMFANVGLNLVNFRGYCFGPFSFWKRELLSLEKSIYLSNKIEFFLKYPAFRFLSFFANRWVFLLEVNKN